MEKEFTMGQIKDMTDGVLTAWDKIQDSIKISNMKSLYNLIAIKKQLEEHSKQLSEALVLLFRSNNCEPTEDGQGFKVPDDKIEIVNQKYAELMEERITFSYDAIELCEGDVFPPILLEPLFDFVSFTDI